MRTLLISLTLSSAFTVGCMLKDADGKAYVGIPLGELRGAPDSPTVQPMTREETADLLKEQVGAAVSAAIDTFIPGSGTIVAAILGLLGLGGAGALAVRKTVVSAVKSASPPGTN